MLEKSNPSVKELGQIGDEIKVIVLLTKGLRFWVSDGGDSPEPRNDPYSLRREITGWERQRPVRNHSLTGPAKHEGLE